MNSCRFFFTCLRSCTNSSKVNSEEHFIASQLSEVCRSYTFEEITFTWKVICNFFYLNHLSYFEFIIVELIYLIVESCRLVATRKKGKWKYQKISSDQVEWRTSHIFFLLFLTLLRMYLNINSIELKWKSFDLSTFRAWLFNDVIASSINRDPWKFSSKPHFFPPLSLSVLVSLVFLATNACCLYSSIRSIPCSVNSGKKSNSTSITSLLLLLYFTFKTHTHLCLSLTSILSIYYPKVT